MLRAVLLFFVVFPASAEDSQPKTEVFKLSDGRVIVGTYDGPRHRLTAAGPITVGITVADNDIVDRRPATDDEIKAAFPPPLTPEEKRQREINACKAAIREAKGKQERLENGLSNWSKKLIEEQDLAQQAQDSAQSTHGEIVQLQAEVAQLTAQWDELEQQRALFEIEVKKYSIKIDDNGKPQDNDVEFTVWRNRLTAADRRLAELKNRIAVAQGNQDDATARYNAQIAEAAKHQKKAADFARQIERAGNEIDAARTQIKEYEAKLADAPETVEEKP